MKVTKLTNEQREEMFRKVRSLLLDAQEFTEKLMSGTPNADDMQTLREVDAGIVQLRRKMFDQQ